MNTTAYASPPRDMHPRSTMPSLHDTAFRQGPPHQGAPYSMPHTMASQHSQIPAYEQYDNSLPSSRPPPEHLPSSEPVSNFSIGLPGQEPSPRSITIDGRKYTYVEIGIQLPLGSGVGSPATTQTGSNDRRPITPPPCVKLSITEIATGKEVDVNNIEHGMFVLNVDLWSADGERPVNLVRHSQTSPSISATVPVSYTQLQGGATAYSNLLPGQGQREPTSPPYGNAPPYQGAGFNPFPGPPQVSPYSQPPAGPGYSGNPNYPPQNGYQVPPQQANYYYPQPSRPVPSQNSQDPYPSRPYTPQDLGMGRIPMSQTNPPQGMFTRNLIGSLSASAFRLTDPDDRIGIWFVLQDLSVRTEGDFRLRFSFVNVGAPSAPQNSANSSCSVNTGKAPVLASCFSDVFKVFSAKKFPGVVESTPLSKCFATQGIKIPIRKDGKDGPGKGGKDGSRGDDDDDY
ncbi:hypothetical protein DSL72_003118 [Monilinia vaccinii-corymbosi]|uniref:Velvet domain-containing protein n=1 Tax=Monilinia vaccinii-corymbosi TaxID=61207 RepID=A0A8A3P7J0_9HELO|nr:hypothetical protein DSL72_003118 [Monilinia vaccinii-corymbosi]